MLKTKYESCSYLGAPGSSPRLMWRARMIYLFKGGEKKVEDLLRTVHPLDPEGMKTHSGDETADWFISFLFLFLISLLLSVAGCEYSKLKALSGTLRAQQQPKECAPRKLSAESPMFQEKVLLSERRPADHEWVIRATCRLIFCQVDFNQIKIRVWLEWKSCDWSSCRSNTAVVGEFPHRRGAQTSAKPFSLSCFSHFLPDKTTTDYRRPSQHLNLSMVEIFDRNVYILAMISPKCKSV